jgi:hypothetical protein
MSRIAYRTDNIPANGAGAFMPVPARTGTSATAGVMRRFAQFGKTTAAPNPQLKAFAPGPPYDSAVQGSFADPPPGLPLAFDHQSEFSSREPYWTSPNANGVQQMGASGAFLTMKLSSDNPLPMPSGDFVRSAGVAMKQSPWATAIATAWPRPYTVWSTWGQSRSA